MDSAAALTTSAVLAAYLLFYTAFDKASKTLSVGLLLDTLLVRRNLTHTLLELNKAISLAGLTVLALAYLPSFEAQSGALKVQALGLLGTHSSLSFNKLYGSKLWPAISKLPKAGLPRLGGEGVEAMKFLSLSLGQSAMMSVVLGLMGYITAKQSALAALTLGTGHFYTMEIDYKGVLQVRPFAYLAVLLPVVAIAAVATGITSL
jgi:hypothetical protein